MSEFKTRLHSVPSGGFLTDRDKDKKPILDVRELGIDRKSTRLNSSHYQQSRMPSSA